MGKMASDRSKWRKLIHESIESFENSRMQYSAYKRLIHKGEQGVTLGPQNHHANCDICGKLCLSLADLKSHLRKCAKSILQPNNVTANKTDWLCQFCGKIFAVWLARRVTYEHIEFKGVDGESERNEIKEVVTIETERTVIIYIYIYIIENKNLKICHLAIINLFLPATSYEKPASSKME